VQKPFLAAIINGFANIVFFFERRGSELGCVETDDMPASTGSAGGQQHLSGTERKKEPLGLWQEKKHFALFGRKAPENSLRWRLNKSWTEHRVNDLHCYNSMWICPTQRQ